MFEVIPSPGTEDKDWPSLERKIELVKPFTKTIHIDILDGIYAPNTTLLDPNPFKKYTGDIFFEVHLMVDEPINYIEQFAQAGFRRFIGQVERMGSQEEFLKIGRQYGEVGLALDRQTGVEEIRPSFEGLDTLLVMTIQTGFSGQTFIPELLDKVRVLREKCNLPIEVDGGINDETIIIARNSGATRFVATSFLFSDDNPEEKFNQLTSSL